MRNPVALKASRRYCACRVGIRAERGGRWRRYEPHEPAEVFIRKAQLGARPTLRLRGREYLDGKAMADAIRCRLQ
jgi:hypothetical protein